MSLHSTGHLSCEPRSYLAPTNRSTAYLRAWVGRHFHWITSSAPARIDCGIVRPMVVEHRMPPGSLIVPHENQRGPVPQRPQAPRVAVARRRSKTLINLLTA